MKLIESKQVLIRLAFEQGPRITRQDFIQLDNGNVVRVDFWTENNRIVKISAPVTVN